MAYSISYLKKTRWNYKKDRNTTINISTLLKPDLMSRFAVADLLLYIHNTGSESVVVDFAGVKFATRSFVDEYYNLIMKNQSSIKIETINIPEDIQVIFDVVQFYYIQKQQVCHFALVMQEHAADHVYYAITGFYGVVYLLKTPITKMASELSLPLIIRPGISRYQSPR